MDNIAEKMQEIINYLVTMHELHAGGCKSSCWEREIGYQHSSYYAPYWYCKFGGYCFGTMPRHMEVRAPDISNLLPEIKKVFAEHIDNPVA